MAGEPAPAGCEPFDDEPQATGSANAQQSAATRTAALRRRIESDDSVTQGGSFLGFIAPKY